MLPRDEKDLALLTIILGCEIKVKDSVSTFVIRDRTGKIIVSFFWIPKLFYLDLLSLLINFEHNEPVSPLCFQLQELKLAFITHMHPRR
ncbi:hypothetical protein CARUB_v10002331mg [Capsella rubella]|uniref:Uncharacterized protein n=1 Tax=Capsella rubella TaxID=81985 RepID=R0H4C5_9BRAS|nr:hypothetical protein CARUB_v10002331mg [Capsella rubella]